MKINQTNMIDYYAKRASEYEDIYQKPERQSDLKQLQAMISGAFHAQDTIEIACGTGYWTQFACRSAKSILATDYNDEVLSIAREKDYGNCPITFIKSDAYVLYNIDGLFTSALVGFWWSHIPKQRIAQFLRVLHPKLIPGASIIVLDNRFVEGSSTPLSRTDMEGNSYQKRRLRDGSEHEVLKNFPTQTEFIRQIEPHSDEYEFTILDYFWLAQYKLKKSVQQHNSAVTKSRQNCV